jgi:hypothetical protein
MFFVLGAVVKKCELEFKATQPFIQLSPCGQRLLHESLPATGVYCCRQRGEMSGWLDPSPNADRLSESE